MRPLVIADKAFVKLKDHWQVKFQLGANNIPTTAYFYVRNSLRDPWYYAGGGQPAGFLQWMGFYRQFLCYAMKISVTINAAANIPNTGVLIRPMDDTQTVSSLIDFQNWTDLPDVRYRYFGGDPEGNGQESNARQATVKHYCTLKKIYGNSALDAAQYAGILL